MGAELLGVELPGAELLGAELPPLRRRRRGAWFAGPEDSRSPSGLCEQSPATCSRPARSRHRPRFPSTRRLHDPRMYRHLTRRRHLDDKALYAIPNFSPLQLASRILTLPPRLRAFSSSFPILEFFPTLILFFLPTTGENRNWSLTYTSTHLPLMSLSRFRLR